MFETKIGENNYKVKFWHDWMSPGTQCQIFEDNRLVAVGNALVHPADPIVKAIGRKLTLQRALDDGGFDRFERAQIWEEYWRRTSPSKLKVRR